MGARMEPVPVVPGPRVAGSVVAPGRVAPTPAQPPPARAGIRPVGATVVSAPRRARAGAGA